MTVSHIIGIDPGLSGAIALLEVASGELFDVTDMPTIATTDAKGKTSNSVDAYEIVETLLDYINHADDPEQVAIVIEQQSTRPGLAAGSVFKTAEGYGILQGIAAASCCQITIVRPQDWKAAHGLIGAGGDLPAGSKRTRAIKLASRQAAMKLHPHHADMFKRAKDDGRAEAVLIASAHLRNLTAHP
jgi:crossover junction endodeoxyribonuclease RuvC